LNNGVPTNAVGDFDTCFHIRLGGTLNVLHWHLTNFRLKY
jgi:hypothetical protein